MMQISISYASRRSEVWNWYWHSWRSGLWRTHLAVFCVATISASLLFYGGAPHGLPAFLTIAMIGIIPLISFAIFPMLMFKPQVRTLIVDEGGIETTIGKISASVPWKDILEVRDDDDYLIIQRTNKNAFIVPPRAFETMEAKSRFRDFVASMTTSSGN